MITVTIRLVGNPRVPIGPMIGILGTFANKDHLELAINSIAKDGYIENGSFVLDEELFNSDTLHQIAIFIRTMKHDGEIVSESQRGRYRYAFSKDVVPVVMSKTFLQ